MSRWLKVIRIALLASLCGCAATCQDFRMGCTNEMGGTDWIVVQYGFRGDPTACWVVKDTPLNGTDVSTKWIDDRGHIVFINYPHNIVQVSRGEFETAARTLGVDLSRCKNGAYLP